MFRFLFNTALLAFPGFLAAETVWQLGVPDGSVRDFQYHYHAWEYGNASYLRNHPSMDSETGVFTYRIDKNEVIAKPAMINGINTPSILGHMPKEEVASAIRLRWVEPAAGNRRFSFRAGEWTNQHQGENGILVLLPGNRRAILNLPAGHQGEAGPQDYAVEFPVEAGSNELTIRIATRAKHYRLRFDYLKLETVEKAAPLPPVVELTPNDPDGIYPPGGKAECAVALYNRSGEHLSYEIRDFFGKTVASGNVEQAKINLPTAVRGHFRLAVRLGKELLQTTSYAVVEPVQAEFKPDSRFGCHAYRGDGYATRPLRFEPERSERKARRAAAAGARWARYHVLNWGSRERKQGEYNWSGLDESLAIMEKHQICSLWNVVYIPAWNSPSAETKLTICGEQRRFIYAPKDYEPWAEFLRQLATRYRGRVRWYELGNEPGYQSAFWGSGSPREFADLLRYGYAAIKKADPAAQVLSGAPLSIDFFEEVLRDSGNKANFDLMSIHYPGNVRRNSVKTANWRSLLAGKGIHTPIVNSEDMSWRDGKKSSELIAADMVKSYVRDASQGVVKTFGFQMFDDNSNSLYSFFDLKEAPHPSYPAYRAMTHRLEDAAYVGDLSGADFEAYLFNRGGTPVVIFWSDREQELIFELGGAPQRLVSFMDVESVPAGGKVAASVYPQFLEGGDAAFLARLAAALEKLPQQLTLRPGKTWQLPEGVTVAGIVPPAGWPAATGGIKAPANAAPGLYDAAFKLDLDGRLMERPVTVELVIGNPGENLISNGNFARGTAFWFYPAKGGFTAAEGRAKIKGGCHFGTAGAIKVRPGERYLLSYDVKGEGSLGFAYSLRNKEGKAVFPAKPGINALYTQTSGGEWNRRSEVIIVNTPGAEQLKIALLANYQFPQGEIEVTNVSAVRLEGNLTPEKVLNTGSFVMAPAAQKVDGDPAKWAKVPGMTATMRAQVVESPGAPWRGPDDLSGECKLMLGKDKLYLAFFVRDDVVTPGIDDAATSWRKDSIQVAFDPRNEGQYATELILCRDSGGRPAVFKVMNFWTPELPENLTRRGVLADAEMVVKAIPGGLFYEAAIPLRELYPLSAKQEEFGFSWLINDDDGKGRKYIEWSSGIGGRKSPALFGTVRK